MKTLNDQQVQPKDLAEDAIKLARKWLTEGSKLPADPAAKKLAGVLQDPSGLDFTVGFVDGVVRPEDSSAAAKKLNEITPLTPKFLAAPLRAAVGLGGTFAETMPGIVVPAARKVLRQMVSHLIIDASDKKLGKSIAKIKRDGVGLNINLLGEAILGENEAKRRLDGTHKLLARKDIDYVSIKTSSVMAPHNHWAYDEAVANITEHLVPLYRVAAQSNPKKFINLDMEEYKDLDITIDVFTNILDKPEFLNLEAGIVLQAYLPDALGAMVRIQEWAAERVANGGAPVKVRVVKGANLPMERVAAKLHGWPLATWSTKQDSDTHYKRVLDYALTSERVKNVRIGVAGHNLFDLALAWLLAKERGAAEGMEVEMLLGMATGQAEAVRADIGSLLLYTPVVHPEEFDVAIAYLIRRLEEGASSDNFMSAVFDLHDNETLFEREKTRFLKSIEALPNDAPASNRVQNRNKFDTKASKELIKKFTDDPYAFQNTPDTDPDLAPNREWGRGIASRMVDSQLGKETVAAAAVSSQEELEEIIVRGKKAAASWQALGAKKRAKILHAAGERMQERRADLLEVMGSEVGKTLDQGDPEVSEAIDFAHYYAGLGGRLIDVDGAVATPVDLTAVIPPWNFPVAISAGGTLAALSSGSAVIIKPATSAARSGAVMAECLWQAGVPKDVLQMVQFDDRAVSSKLIVDDRIERLILTGGYETAETFKSMRADLPMLAETSGKNAIIVTPNADLDLAAADVVQSAFGHAGQKCSAASLVILVGSVSKSARFNGQLLDAVQSLKSGTPDDLTSQMGPVIAPPEGKLLRGLTTLQDDESWLVKPVKVASESPLAAGGKLWQPGVRSNVRRGSEFHMTEYFGPILGIMHAETLDEAIDMVNDIEYGLTSGLHSLDSDEIELWLRRVQAGNLYINRGITGAIVQRQPFGGWKKSAIGAGTKAGGPNYLHGLVKWHDAPVETTSATPNGAVTRIIDVASNHLAQNDFSWLKSALSSDAQAWNEEFGQAKDVSNLGVERNILRYLPNQTIVRGASDAPLAHILRAVAAGVAAAARPVLSVADTLPADVMAALQTASVSVFHETDETWQKRVKNLAARQGKNSDARIRLVADEHNKAVAEAEIYEASGGKPDIALYSGSVVSAGRVEMLPHLKEQAISITAHRFGTPNKLTEKLI